MPSAMEVDNTSLIGTSMREARSLAAINSVTWSFLAASWACSSSPSRTLASASRFSFRYLRLDAFGVAFSLARVLLACSWIGCAKGVCVADLCLVVRFFAFVAGKFVFLMICLLDCMDFFCFRSEEVMDLDFQLSVFSSAILSIVVGPVGLVAWAGVVVCWGVLDGVLAALGGAV